MLSSMALFIGRDSTAVEMAAMMASEPTMALTLHSKKPNAWK